MFAKRMKEIALTLGLAVSPLFAQDPQSASVPETPRQGKTAIPPRTNPTGVTVNPAQPYRPLPTGGVQRRETIFEFYIKALNPRNIHWGNEIDRRIAILIDNSLRNPYFRFCAAQMGVIVILLGLCWAWWDKLRQVKWIAAEQLTDVLNAKHYADKHAMEAINAHNRHMEACNRVIEQELSGIGKPVSSGLGLDVEKLQNDLAAARAETERLNAEIRDRDEKLAKQEDRLRVIESKMAKAPESPNAELIARLQRAEAQLNLQNNRKQRA
jgi:hypothetical protein